MRDNLFRNDLHEVCQLCRIWILGKIARRTLNLPKSCTWRISNTLQQSYFVGEVQAKYAWVQAKVILLKDVLGIQVVTPLLKGIKLSKQKAKIILSEPAQRIRITTNRTIKHCLLLLLEFKNPFLDRAANNESGHMDRLELPQPVDTILGLQFGNIPLLFCLEILVCSRSIASFFRIPPACISNGTRKGNRCPIVLRSSSIFYVCNARYRAKGLRCLLDQTSASAMQRYSLLAWYKAVSLPNVRSCAYTNLSVVSSCIAPQSWLLLHLA